MHEIGHNLGLRHSNEDGNAYEDQTGMMGTSYPQKNGPVMCFNNAKNWQFGWYENRHTTVRLVAKCSTCRVQNEICWYLPRKFLMDSCL